MLLREEWQLKKLVGMGKATRIPFCICTFTKFIWYKRNKWNLFLEVGNVWNTIFPPMRQRGNVWPHSGSPERKQKSCEHLGNFKVGQSSLKIALKSKFSHSNWVHSGFLKSFDLTLPWAHINGLTYCSKNNSKHLSSPQFSIHHPLTLNR